MNIELTEKWITLLSAIIAAVAGVWNLFLQIFGKHDDFVVGMGAATPTIEQETMIHVISYSDHRINLKDWGFIDSTGRLNSFRLGWETGDLQSDEITSRGSSDLDQRGDVFETGYITPDIILGGYAISMTQRWPRICFQHDVALWQRLWVQLRLVWLTGRYLA